MNHYKANNATKIETKKKSNKKKPHRHRDTK